MFCLSKLSTIHLPKRDELGFRSVMALPKASRMGLDWITRLATSDIETAAEPPKEEMEEASAPS